MPTCPSCKNDKGILLFTSVAPCDSCAGVVMNKKEKFIKVATGEKFPLNTKRYCRNFVSNWNGTLWCMNNDLTSNKVHDGDTKPPAYGGLGSYMWYYSHEIPLNRVAYSNCIAELD